MPRSKELSEQMRAESRAQIIAAARHLFADRGYFKCTVSDIAREAGMSQGNVYWYFKSKEDLLKAVLAEGFGALEAMTREVAAHPGPAQDKIDYLIECSFALYEEQGDFTTILLSLMAHGGTPFLEELGFDMLQIGASYHQNLVAVFAQGQAEGHVVGINPNILVMFFFAFFNGLMVTYRDDWSSLPSTLIREAILRLISGDLARKE